MKVIVFLLGLAALFFTAGCEDEHEHHHHEGYQGGTYEGPGYPGYGHGEYNGYGHGEYYGYPNYHPYPGNPH